MDRIQKGQQQLLPPQLIKAPTGLSGSTAEKEVKEEQFDFMLAVAFFNALHIADGKVLCKSLVVKIWG